MGVLRGGLALFFELDFIQFFTYLSATPCPAPRIVSKRLKTQVVFYLLTVHKILKFAKKQRNTSETILIGKNLLKNVQKVKAFEKTENTEALLRPGSSKLEHTSTNCVFFFRRPFLERF